METNRNFAAQLPMNLAENIAYFQTNVVNGILLVFYLISTHRVAACGHIRLTTSITEYGAIIVQFLNRAISRYLAFYLQEEKITGPIVAVCNVIQTFSSGVA